MPDVNVLARTRSASRGKQRIRRRYAVMHRQLSLLLMLQSEDGVSISDILNKFHVEDGTIYRDLKLLQDVGIKLRKERISGRVYWRADQFRGEEALKRQWGVVRLLSASKCGVTVATLAHDLEVCDKTIRRDLQVLLEAGFPLTSEPTDSGQCWKLLSRGGLYA